ncbi:MAG TPA: hypothetical protein DCF91_12495 [Porphyromonadaceae bacterium]|nr:hypothetical protein [Porphyromonadaceae bacterium]
MNRISRLRDKAKSLKVELSAIYLALKDRRTPILAKILIAVTISYALSPIDLIPDFIPVLGLVDDLLIIPLMITLSLKLIPKDVMNECRKKAESAMQINKKLGIYAAVLIAAIWILLIISITMLIINQTK